MKLPMRYMLFKRATLSRAKKFSISLVKRNDNLHEDHILDSSINTMEQILSILHNAHGTKTDTKESLIDMYDSDPKEFLERNLTSLGDHVFKLKTIDILIALQLKSGIDIFKDSHPNHTKTVLHRYISAFKDQYSQDSSSPSMSNVGMSFIQNPQQVNARLKNKISNTALIAMKDIPTVSDNSSLRLDFCRVNLYNPFRNGTVDPFALRKGLNTKKNPENLFSAMINDHKVLLGFLRYLKKRVLPIAIQNVMLSQSFYGDLALKVVVKSVLSGKDPRAILGTPFEFYHLDIPEEGNRIKEMKAIIASRSMILRRLDWFPPHRKSLAMLEEKKIDNDEKILTIMADMFDRFFGVCYRLDAKYCEMWVKNLIAFYVENNGDEALHDRMLQDSVTEFRTMVSKLSFNFFGARWSENEYLNGKTDSDMKDSGEVKPTRKVQATRKLLAEARRIIPDSKS